MLDPRYRRCLTLATPLCFGLLQRPQLRAPTVSQQMCQPQTYVKQFHGRRFAVTPRLLKEGDWQPESVHWREGPTTPLDD